VFAASGTNVDRISPDSVKNWMAPERTWLSMSGSLPSWLLGNSSIASCPFVAVLMRSMAAAMRTFIGCVTGRLVANL
jgi:hypothetical protein